MTVKELIELLKNEDPDLIVLKVGYEGGYNDVNKLSNVDVVLNYHNDWWYGKHERIDKLHPQSKEEYKDKVVKGIVI